MAEEMDISCSFCLKSRDEVRGLITSDTETKVYICDECISSCSKIIKEFLNKTNKE